MLVRNKPAVKDMKNVEKNLSLEIIRKLEKVCPEVKMLSQPNECKILGRHNSYTMKKRMEEACFVNAGWIVEQILFIPGIFCHLLDQE